MYERVAYETMDHMASGNKDRTVLMSTFSFAAYKSLEQLGACTVWRDDPPHYSGSFVRVTMTAEQAAVWKLIRDDPESYKSCS